MKQGNLMHSLGADNTAFSEGQASGEPEGIKLWQRFGCTAS